MAKKYLLDTSVIIDNPEINLTKLSENKKNKLFITETVLSELDKHKLSPKEEVRLSARIFARAIKDSKFKKSKINTLNGDKIFEVNLKFENVKIPVYVIVRDKYDIDFNGSVNDSKIINVAEDYKLYCVTNDTYFKAIAMSKGIKADNLYWDKLNDPDSVEFMFETKDQNFKTKKWNQVILKETEKNEIEEYETGKQKFFISDGKSLVEQDLEDFDNYLVPPINLEQKFYLKVLESDCKVVVTTGSTGSGKTLMALQAGMKLVKDKNSPINGIVYMRYTINAEDKFSALGYRKGDENTKLGYFNYPLYGAINFIAEQQIIDFRYKEEAQTIKRNAITEELIEEYNIEITDIAHARGITIRNKYVIFDEVQNTPNQILKLIGTRVGKGSKIVFMGDYNQVDHPYLTKERNGLTTLMKLAEKEDFAAGVKLKHTVRSDIAEWFEENING